MLKIFQKLNRNLLFSNNYILKNFGYISLIELE